ncbi:c-type cytochrome [Pseudorhodoplanes sp.]|uniref:c-type cytochrome n=1 Tax=Pseudorhodoplanes sp. TaxID=1934341 RepID=UPI00391A1CA0
MKSHCSTPRDPGLAAAAVAALLLLASGQPAPAQGPYEIGEQIAQRLCGACHGLGRAERSPIPSAPAFRRLEPRVDLGRMQERLQDGIIGGHPEMPIFVLRADEARALVAYMKMLRDQN